MFIKYHAKNTLSLLSGRRVRGGGVNSVEKSLYVLDRNPVKTTSAKNIPMLTLGQTKAPDKQIYCKKNQLSRPSTSIS